MSADAPRSVGDQTSGPDSGRPDRPKVWPTVAGFAATRVLGNLFIRFPYVFLNSISKGLGVHVDTVTLALGVRELGGLAAPQAGRLVDRGHVARVVAGCGALAGLSCLAAATTWFPLFVVVMLIGGAAKISVDLAQNAWIGHNVALSDRGRVVGLVETTWAGSFLLGVPALGWAVDRYGWKAAFVVTGPLLAIVAIISGTRMAASGADIGWASESETEPANVEVEPADAATEPADVGPATEGTPRPSVGVDPVRLKRAVWVFCVMQPLAQMVVFAVNGDWFVTHLHLSTTALATVMALLGLAELVGTMLSVGITDRLGPLRCGMWGLFISVPPMLAITAVGHHVTAAVALMVAMDVALEFAFVAVLPVFSELDVVKRGKAVGQLFVIIMVSRAVGSAIAGRVYRVGGFGASLGLAATACVIGAVALWWARRGGTTVSRSPRPPQPDRYTPSPV